MEISETFESERLVTIYTAPHSVAAEMMRGLLESEGIFAVVSGQELASCLTNIIEPTGTYWCQVQVRSGDQERAQAVLEAVEEGRLRISDDELEQAAARYSDPDV